MSGLLPRDPAATAAQSRVRRIAALVRSELRALSRNGEQILLLALLPMGVLFGSRLIPSLDQSASAAALTTALLASAFTSVAITTGFERRYGVLRALAATPVDRLDITAAKSVVALSVATMQVVVVVVAGRTLSDGLARTALPVAVILALSALAPWAFVVAMSLRAEQVLVLANLVFLLGMAALAWDDAPIVIPTVAILAMLTNPSLTAAASLGAWACAGLVLASRIGRWNE